MLINLVLSFPEYVKKFDESVAKYIPPKKDWTPAENAVYSPEDLYRVPVDKAKNLSFKAIKFQFNSHFENNEIYRNFCKEKKVSPSDLKTIDDFDKIPLLPSDFYKGYPDGRDFARWLANLYSVDLPKIKISGKNLVMLKG